MKTFVFLAFLLGFPLCLSCSGDDGGIAAPVEAFAALKTAPKKPRSPHLDHFPKGEGVRAESGSTGAPRTTPIDVETSTPRHPSESGDSGERALAARVLRAFQEGNVKELAELGTSERLTAEEVERDLLARSWAAMNEEERDYHMKEFNQSMWWDREWKTLEKPDDYLKQNAADLRWRVVRQHRALVKDFDAHTRDLRMVGYERRFSDGQRDWGTARIVYRNRWGELVTIDLIQRAEQWLLWDMRINNFNLMSEAEFKAAQGG